MKPTRRQFLQGGLLGAAGVAGGIELLPRLLARATLLAAGKEGAGGPSSRRVLVLVEMTGGNDGLNTVVPYRDDEYYKARPGIGIPRGQVLRLTDDLGLAPQLEALKALHDQGNLTVVENVGYPEPNRSHFASMDIWHTASAEPVRPGATGWLGRILDRGSLEDRTRELTGRVDPLAVHLDAEPVPLALAASDHVVPSFHDLQDFRLEDRAVRELRRGLAGDDAPGASDDVRFVRSLSRQAVAQGELLAEIVRREKGRAPYPASRLSRNLQQIAQLIGAGLATRIYYTSIAGFDTHSSQAGTHAGLLSDLGDAIGAFFKDLTARGMQDDVLLVTLSEFGRRIRENRSRGTDHGTAAPLFVVGGSVRGGILGGQPDLLDTSGGDLRYLVDFRQVYATVLDRWLGVSPRDVLDGDHEILPFV